MIDSYMTVLAREIPKSTYFAHKQLLNQFIEWQNAENTHQKELRILAIDFIDYLASDDSVAPQTIRSFVSALGNFIAYCHHGNPEVIVCHLLQNLRESPEVDETELAPTSEVLDETTSPSGVPRQCVKNFISILRRSRFGTRTHSYVETILATRSRPSLIRELNLSHFDRERNIIEVGISDQYLVGRYDIISTHEIKLNDKSAKAIQEYIRNNRTATPVDDHNPLFSTAHGRADSSTLRRSLKRTSRKFSPLDSSSGNSHSQILPSDLCWYALSNKTR